MTAPSTIQQLENLDVEVLQVWGELHNSVKTLRSAQRACQLQAEQLEREIDRQMGRLQTLVSAASISAVPDEVDPG